jgi:hypothetical protein
MKSIIYNTYTKASSKSICETPDMKSWPLNHVFTNALFTGQDVKYITTNSTVSFFSYKSFLSQ